MGPLLVALAVFVLAPLVVYLRADQNARSTAPSTGPTEEG